MKKKLVLSVFFLALACTSSWAAGVPLTTDTGTQVDVAVWGDYAAWEDDRSGNRDIYAYQFSTSTLFPLTNSASVHQYNPDVSNQYIVWEDRRGGGNGLYGYDLSQGTTGTEFALGASLPSSTKTHPAIYGDYVVWTDNRNGNSDIYGYDISAGTEKAICTASGTQYLPDIFGKYVVWNDQRNGDWDVYAYDLQNDLEIEIYVGSGHQRNPRISGDRVTWEDGWQYYSFSDGLIHSCGLPAGSKPRETGVDISGDTIVWMDERNGTSNYDLYAHNIVTGQDFTIRTETGNSKWPAIYGETVLWQDDFGGNWDIYTATIPEPSTLLLLGTGLGSLLAFGRRKK